MSPRRPEPARPACRPADARRVVLLVSLLVVTALAGCTAPDESGMQTPTPTTTSGNSSPDANSSPDGDGNSTGEGADDAIPQRGDATVFDDEFEAASLAPWSAQADAASEGATWAIEPSDERAHNGSRSARITLDDTQDAGTIWMVREVNLTPGAGYAVNLSAWVWSPNESMERLADLLLYVGTTPPTGEDSFAPENGGGQHAANREPLDLQEGWRQYFLDWATPVPDNGTLYVAIGVSVVWESGVEYYVDDVRAEFTQLG